MGHEPSGTTYLIGILITAIATVVVALVSRGRGQKAAGSTSPFVPQESGEHAHTRDLIKIEFEALHRRFDTIEATRSAERKSHQLGQSYQNLEDDRRHDR